MESRKQKKRTKKDEKMCCLWTCGFKSCLDSLYFCLFTCLISSMSPSLSYIFHLLVSVSVFENNLKSVFLVQERHFLVWYCSPSPTLNPALLVSAAPQPVFLKVILYIHHPSSIQSSSVVWVLPTSLYENSLGKDHKWLHPSQLCLPATQFSSTQSWWGFFFFYVIP